MRHVLVVATVLVSLACGSEPIPSAAGGGSGGGTAGTGGGGGGGVAGGSGGGGGAVATTKPAPTARGTTKGASSTNKIGPTGGKLTSSDGVLTLTVPAGALASEVDINLEPITNFAPGGFGPAYRLSPDDLTFSKPATLTFGYSRTILAGASVEALRVAWQDADGRWRAMAAPTVDANDGTISVPITRLADWTRLLGWQLLPTEAVAAPLGSVPLKVRYCLPDTSAPELADFLQRCDVDSQILVARLGDWAVEGVLDGSSTLGTLAPKDLSAEYRAPAVTPASNPVAVSVEVVTPEGTKVLAVSNVLVSTGGWTGSVKWTLVGNAAPEPSGGTKYVYVSSGNGEIAFKPAATPPLLEIVSANAQWQYAETTDFSETSMSMGCTVTLTSHTELKLTGASTEGALVHVIFNTTTGDWRIPVTLPTGPASGNRKRKETEVRTGANCVSPPDTDTDQPYSGNMPADQFDLTGNAPVGATQITGTKEFKFGSNPERVYSVTYTLTK